MTLKNALIIGATSAIAQAVARQLAARGTTLVLWGRSLDRLEIVATDLRLKHGAKVFVEAFDLNDASKYQAAVDRAATESGALDLALICHGHLPDQAACEKDLPLAEEEFRINGLGPILLLTVLANTFQAQRSGCLAAISSVAGDRGRQSNYVYGSSKAAVSTFLAGLRNRLFPHGVRVLTIKPGFVDTPMTAHLKKGPLFASPDKVAGDILRAVDSGACVLYTPWFWRWIMLIIRLIPETVFRKLKM